MLLVQTGILSIVGTPIGNLEDITLRALNALRMADVVAAEDTRHSRILLRHHGINVPLVSYHEFNEAQRAHELIQRLKHGQNVALVSDAGMPTLSDPGHRLIRAAIEHGISIQVIPGVSAVTAAVAVSGINAKSFCFHGFLPHKATQRQTLLRSLVAQPYAHVFFESPHRLHKTLADMEMIFRDREVVVARELTKKFEEVLRGRPGDLRKMLEARTIKGEITVVLDAPK